MNKRFTFLLLVAFTYSCEEEVKVTFSEINTVYNENVAVEINIPKAEGNSIVSEAINSKLENHIANSLNFSEEDSDDITFDEAIKSFESDYLEFKKDFEESELIYEATFDGEVIYESGRLICIAITGYTNTGGAHGNMNITLYNFDIATGKILEMKDLISDEAAFTKVVQGFFEKETKSESEDDFADYFYGEDFHLPANIGFNDEGVLILYNTYEIAAFAIGITEFTIPFEDVDPYLKLY